MPIFCFKGNQKINILIPKAKAYNKNFFKIIVSKSKIIPKSLKKKFKAKIEVIYDFGACKYNAKIWQNGDHKDHLEFTKGKIQIIGVGGIDSADSLLEKFENGANAVQLYSSLVYNGLSLIDKILFDLIKIIKIRGYKNISFINKNEKI